MDPASGEALRKAFAAVVVDPEFVVSSNKAKLARIMQRNQANVA